MKTRCYELSKGDIVGVLLKTYIKEKDSFQTFKILNISKVKIRYFRISPPIKKYYVLLEYKGDNNAAN